MTKKVYLLLSLLLVFLFYAKTVFSQGSITTTATPSEGCAPLTTKLVASHPTTNYFEWSIEGINLVGKEITHTFFDNPYVYVTAFDTTGGNKVYLNGKQVIVNLISSLNFYFSKDTLCVNGDLNVSGNSSQALTIDFGDGTIVRDNYASHIYTRVGSYSVKITGKNSCNENFEYLKNIVVKNDLRPTPQFYIPYNGVCPGEVVYFSADRQSQSSKYTWLFGDGATTTKGYTEHSWANQGTYKISLSETNSCGLTNSVTKDIVISSNKKITNPGVYVSARLACPNTKIRFNVSDRQSYKSIVFNYGDNKTSSGLEDFEHAYVAAGRYFPKVTLTNFCNDDTTFFIDTITIRSNLKWSVDEDLMIDVEDSVCPGQPFYYYAENDKAISYEWDLEGGVTSKERSGIHSYSTIGKHILAVTLTNGCGLDTTINGVVVVTNNLPATDSDFYSPSDSICPGDTAMVIADNNHFKDYKWNFGDGTTSNTTYDILFREGESDFKINYNRHAYSTPGVYNVKIEFYNYCGNKGVDSLKIFVKSNLKVDTEEYDVETLDYPATTCRPVRFFGYSGKSYTWNFGDGSAPVVSNKFITAHAYSQAGDYNVSLMLTNSCGNSGTVSDVITVTSDCILEVSEARESENILSVFPNPVSDISTINVSSNSTVPANIYLVDAFGIRRPVANNLVVNSLEELTLNAQALNLVEGIYMLCLEQGGEVISKKISVIK